MKLKSLAYYLALFILIFTPLALSYFILVNTVFAQSVLPNVRIFDRDLSFLSEEETRAVVKAEALKLLPKSINVIFEDKTYTIPSEDLDFDINSYNIVNYGKGPDFFKVLSEAINVFSGIEMNVEYSFNTDSLLSSLGFSKKGPLSYVENNQFNCNENNIPLNSIKREQLQKDLVQYIKNNKTFDLKLKNYLNKDEQNLYLGCLKFRKDAEKIQNNFLNIVSNSPLRVEDYFTLNANDNNLIWEFKNENAIIDLLFSYKELTEIQTYEGEFDIVSEKIYLYKTPKEGIALDLNKNITLLENWINSTDLNTNPIQLDFIKPQIHFSDFPIYDFTKVIGEGKTRIELIRNGQANAVIPFTMFGLDEIDKMVIEPNQEFSYINTIQPQGNGLTKAGRPIAPGICNSTTTLFRAVLESGLKVTDRSSHAFQVASYNWGYDYNIVDAAYFTSPAVDFKFSNNSEYPIMIKVEYSKDNDFQYNSVKLLSSSEFVEREVELTNWKIWDKYSNSNFKASFDQIVKENGTLLFADNFYSHYL